MQKPIALAFPGMGTNKDIMQLQMGSLHTLLTKIIDIEYMQPPYEVGREILDEQMLKLVPPDQKLYRWGDKYLKFDNDLKLVYQKIMENPNICGLIGFSMGTIILRELGYMAMKDSKLKQRLKFMIFFSSNGFKNEKSYFNDKGLIQIPSLHTIGLQDWLAVETIIQSSKFLNPLVIHTQQNHRIPKLDRDQKQILLTFVKQHIPNQAVSL